MAVLLITSCDTSTQYNVSYGSALNPGSIYYLTFTGSTPSGCYTYNGVGSSPIDDIDTVSSPYGDCLTCQNEPTSTPTPTPTLTPTTTETPTPTPTLTQTPTTTGNNSYYLTGCCDGSTLNILSGAIVLPLNLGDVVHVIWDTNDKNNCFTVVGPQVGYPTYVWDSINDSVSSPYVDCDTCIVDNEVPCPTPTPTPTLTPTPTNTETPTLTPTSTPTNTPPCECQYVSVSVGQPDLNAASGNTDPSLNGVIFYQYNICASPSPQTYESYSVAGNYVDSVCINANQFTASLLYYFQDDNPIDSQTSPGSFVSSFSLGGCCTDPIPTTTPTNTPTPTNTETPNPTNTETPTPTNTETPTPTVTPTNTETPTQTPTNTETPTETPTQTQTETPSETPTQTPTNTETTTVTPTPTNTTTPTLTPTVTPFYNYYFTGCCGGETYRIGSGTPLSILPGDFVYLTISGGNINNCFEVVSNIPVADITYTWNPGGGDAFYDYDNCVDCLTANTVSCGGAILITACDPPNTTYIVDYDATLPAIGTVLYMTFTGSTPSGCYTITSSLVSGPIDKVDNKITYPDCLTCSSSLPTPTPTPTTTTTPTNTSTPTPTITEPYDIYLFEECGNPSNQFRFENVPGTLVVGQVFLISGPYFNGYATVIPYVATGSIYPSVGSIFTGAGSCPTPTPTPTVTTTQTQTPTVTPTVTPSGGPCSNTYCFNTTLSTLSGYSGNYVFTGLTYGGYSVYVGDGTTIGYVYNTGNQWCLSSTLGGSCLLSGTTPCESICPDISANNFTSGPCPTPTPSSVNCETFDFTAYFDCDWEPLPTPSPSVDCGDVDFDVTSIGVTPTPTPSGNFCSGTGVSFSICQYTPANPTPTITPTITLTKTVDVQGQATFVMLDEMFSCVNVKILVDCETGNELYTNDSLIYSGTPITTGITISAIINGSLMCVTYSGTSNNISSNCYIDEIIAISSSCETCNVFPSPTPTGTSQPTQTPTVTPTMTMNATPTPTPGATPTPTSQWVYVYESCGPLGQQFINTQVIQTVQVVPTTMIPNRTFQDLQGRCWKYVGQFATNYIAPPTVLSITYTGNYMGGTLFQAAPIFTNCTDCLNWQGFKVTYFGANTPNANSAQNACLGYVNNRPYYTNTTILAVGVRVYDTFTSVPTNGNNNWVVLKSNTSSNLGKAVKINTTGYITAIQDVNTNSC
jgi:hypothetical protein